MLSRLQRLAGEARSFATGDRDRVKAEWFFRAASRFTDTILTRGEYRYYIDTGDFAVGRNTFLEGGYDEAQMDTIMAGIDVRGRTVLDVGANIGTTTVPFVRRYGAGRVLAFEPGPRNFKLLRHNVIENDCDEHVTALQVALSDSDGHVQFGLSRFNHGDHRVFEANDIDSGDRAVIGVEARTLDSLVADKTVDLDQVGLVWIDVQGHEARVMAGAGRLLAAEIPVLMEYSPDLLRARGDLERLEDLIAANFETVTNYGFPESDERVVRKFAASDIKALRDVETYVDLLLT